MPVPHQFSRRSLIKTAGCGLAAAAAASPVAHALTSEEHDPHLVEFHNQEFYGADGTFLVDKAKDAILRLCQYHHYPVFPGLADGLWVSDYGIGQFTTLGLAAYIFVNNVADRYMMLDLFILPGQMLPEHWHVAAEGNPAKLEGWLVRWGLSHIVGVGQPNLGPGVIVPPCHWNGRTTAQHAVVGTPGTFVPLAQVESPHWQFGGPAGAVVTEVANVHTSSGVRHSDPVLNENFLKAL